MIIAYNTVTLYLNITCFTTYLKLKNYFVYTVIVIPVNLCYNAFSNWNRS